MTRSARQTVRLILGLALALAGPVGAQTPCPDPARPRAPEAAFGPEQDAQALILAVLAGAQQRVQLAAFALSAPAVVQALRAAAGRGVRVQAVADHRHNVAEDPRGLGRRALDALHAAGVELRTHRGLRLHHDKFIVVDGCHVQTGSWNYADSARQNSENVLVLWNEPALAAAYAAHWQRRFDEATPWR